ncbi:MAG: Fur family transcriptional regulator [Lachnospiraceae bacterium]|nr:Fur family transcriptional regulator [Lachnospiraceae bacterium]
MSRDLKNDNRQNRDVANFHRTEMQKELVIQKLREKGCRITKQRQILLDVILREEIGAISRKNMYQISCCMNCDKEDACTIELDDHTVCRLSAQNWYKVISEGLRACGYVESQNVTKVMIDFCESE